MDKLLQPDTGLVIWTIVTFLCLVLILTKTTWKPILEALNKREGKIRSDLDRAEKSQQEAEALRQKYEAQLAEAQRSIQEMMTRARADADKARAELVGAAKHESERLLEKGRQDLVGETERLKQELRGEVAGLSVSIAEKILNRSVDPKIQQDVLKDSLKSIHEARQ